MHHDQISISSPIHTNPPPDTDGKPNTALGGERNSPPATGKKGSQGK